MNRRREDVRYLRDTAVKLLEIAAEMESPRTIAATAIHGECANCEVHCPGPFRAEHATDRAGNDLGVSMGQLAEQGMRDFEQGMRDFLADDPDHDDDDTADWPDIASTYRGRR